MPTAQCQDFFALIPPFFDRQHHDDWESSLALKRQEFVILLYQNAAVVFSQATFVNTGSLPLTVELALPSTGYAAREVLGATGTSNGLLGVRAWVDDERAKPELLRDSEAEWVVISPLFHPARETRVRAMFWVQTSLVDLDSLPSLENKPISQGERAVWVLLSKAAIWKSSIDEAKVTLILKDGLAITDSTLNLTPPTYDAHDSTVTWTSRNIEPSTNDDILAAYLTSGYLPTAGDTMEQLARVALEDGYDELLEYTREERMEE